MSKRPPLSQDDALQKKLTRSDDEPSCSGSGTPDVEMETIGEVTETVGEGTETVDERMETVGEGTESIGEGTETLDECTESVGGGTESVGELVETVGEDTESVGEGTETVGEGTKTVGELVETVGERTESVGERVELVGERALPDIPFLQRHTPPSPTLLAYRIPASTISYRLSSTYMCEMTLNCVSLPEALNPDPNDSSYESLMTDDGTPSPPLLFPLEVSSPVSSPSVTGEALPSTSTAPGETLSSTSTAPAPTPRRASWSLVPALRLCVTGTPSQSVTQMLIDRLFKLSFRQTRFLVTLANSNPPVNRRRSNDSSVDDNRQAGYRAARVRCIRRASESDRDENRPNKILKAGYARRS